MDPEATLQRAEQAFRDGDFSEAMEMIGSHRRWRRLRWPTPRHGDRRAQQVERTVRRWMQWRWRQQNAH